MDIVEFNKSNIQRHPWELARFELLVEILNDHLPQTGIKRILDIGCGDCFFAREMLKRRKDIEIIGIDTAYTEEEILAKVKDVDQKRFKLFTSMETATKELARTPVHLILLLDVLEHLQNDIGFLTGVCTGKYVTGETQLLITVPAFQWLFTDHDYFLKHFRRYNLKSLEKSIFTAGFYPVQSGYFFLSLLPVRLFQKVRRNLGFRQQEKGIGQWKQSNWVTQLFKKYLLFDYHFCKNLHKAGIRLPGLSAYSICKKPV